MLLGAAGLDLALGEQVHPDRGAQASLLTRSGLRLMEGGFKMSIHRSKWEQAYLPMSYAHLRLGWMTVLLLVAISTVLLLWLRFAGLRTELTTHAGETDAMEQELPLPDS